MGWQKIRNFVIGIGNFKKSSIVIKLTDRSKIKVEFVGF
jgi:hypothetical protein